MKLPNLSYMMSVGELRYIQSHFERGAAKNPDGLVGGFLPWSKRVGCWVRGTLLLPKLRANPFYGYLNARTKYYDQVFGEALERSITRIVNIGCGSDTRAQRFAGPLRAQRVEVLECDQEPAIRAKEQLARRLWGTSDHVAYLPIDLEAGAWPALEAWLARGTAAPTLVMLEGVSPYVGEKAFAAFLRMLSGKLPPPAPSPTTTSCGGSPTTSAERRGAAAFGSRPIAMRSRATIATSGSRSITWS